MPSNRYNLQRNMIASFSVVSILESVCAVYICSYIILALLGTFFEFLNTSQFRCGAQSSGEIRLRRTTCCSFHKMTFNIKQICCRICIILSESNFR